MINGQSGIGRSGEGAKSNRDEMALGDSAKGELTKGRNGKWAKKIIGRGGNGAKL